MVLQERERDKNMKKIELRDYLLKNYVNAYGDLDITSLDFSDFNGNIYLWNMKVKGDLFQSNLEVQGNLHQGSQKVQGTLHQDDQEVQGNLSQSFQTVQGTLYQSGQEVKGDYICKNVKVQGNIDFEEPIKILKPITLEELAKLGYELK